MFIAILCFGSDTGTALLPCAWGLCFPPHWDVLAPSKSKPIWMLVGWSGDFFSAVLAMMRQIPRNIHVGWPGWWQKWGEGSQVSWHYNICFALEGSHAVVFRRNGLQQFWEATCATARYRHLDVMLSQRLAGGFWYRETTGVWGSLILQ